MRSIRIGVMTVLMVAILQASSGAAVRDELTRAPLPPNAVMDDDVREMVERSVALSPTLRRQFDVIGGAAARVEIRVSGAPMLGLRRAAATIDRYDAGFIRAQVVIPPGTDFVELLAHELEHVLEQIEGVDLAALVRTKGATRDSAGIFETVRARDAGRAAAIEVEEGSQRVTPHEHLD